MFGSLLGLLIAINWFAKLRNQCERLIQPFGVTLLCKRHGAFRSIAYYRRWLSSGSCKRLLGLILIGMSYPVDPAGSHMLVFKTKPCKSKYKQFIRRNCRWLIKTVIVYLMVFYYMDNRSNSRANTCLKA